eukprot:CAMPEP_0198212628 /NCGR_PEP_ID=MMETSP1445-20131203/26849_1 /TAXON_ID=36898 /ORGANISM="Pyramimonas sp., Strain CCMP2087" /LENGTH=602 /DNA_ID=CAMNT_0043887123 /DNA_START=226 /DNA_END=2034 /DNA_ORIENTATION=-
MAKDNSVTYSRSELQGSGGTQSQTEEGSSEGSSKYKFSLQPSAGSVRYNTGYVAEDAKVSLTEDGYYKLKDDETKGINPFEKTKLAKDALASLKWGNDLESMATKAKEDFKAMYEEDKGQVDLRTKYIGLFHRPKTTYGRFMMRLRQHNGIITAKQMRYLGEVIQSYGEDGCADITTRQNIQLRGVVLPDVPEMFENFTKLGLTTTQSGMDNVRNLVGSPIAGIDPLEIVDTRPYCKMINDFLTDEDRGHKEVTNLPRKFNIAVIGSHDLYEHPHINDLAFMPAEKDGVFGFNVEVGGFFSAIRVDGAIPLGAFVPPEQMIPITHAILTTFRDYGARKNRQKTRLMYLIEEMGMDKFRAEIEKRMIGGSGIKSLAEEGKSLVNPKWERRSYFGAHKQTDGNNFVGINVPVGRLFADDMLALAHLAETYGDGDIRMTVEQNVILSGVPDAKLAELMGQPLLAKDKFDTAPGHLTAHVVSCPGSQFCGFGQIETKQTAKEMSEHLERTLDMPKEVRIHWTGCPNTCGQVQVADLGFLGTQVKGPNGPEPAVDIFMGGTIGHDSVLANCVMSKVAVRELRPVVEALLIEHFGATYKEAVREPVAV